jgi:hypothetical protein
MMSKTDKLPTNNQLANLWYKNYASTGFCVLCGNNAIIDTRGKVFTPAGFECGDIVFCICPNGQALQRGYDKQGLKLK